MVLKRDPEGPPGLRVLLLPTEGRAGARPGPRDALLAAALDACPSLAPQACGTLPGPAETLRSAPLPRPEVSPGRGGDSGPRPSPRVGPALCAVRPRVSLAVLPLSSPRHPQPRLALARPSVQRPGPGGLGEGPSRRGGGADPPRGGKGSAPPATGRLQGPALPAVPAASEGFTKVRSRRPATSPVPTPAPRICVRVFIHLLALRGGSTEAPRPAGNFEPGQVAAAARAGDVGRDPRPSGAPSVKA